MRRTSLVASAATLLALLAVLLTTAPEPVEAVPRFLNGAGQARVGSAGNDLRRRSRPTKRELEQAQRIFQQRIQQKKDEVASKYPVRYISNVTNEALWDEFQDPSKDPQPIRGKTGATNAGPDDTAISRQKPDLYAPPTTDAGTVPNAIWPFSLSHNRLQNGGWARQQNVDVLPVATEMAGVNMRLEEGAYRELHWHKDAEWAYILNGTFRVGAVDQDGRNEVADVSEGDLWYFPSNVPHYIQALSPGGGEFLLVFDSGSFSEDATLLLSDLFAHIPRGVLLKEMDGAITNKDLNKAPGEELYIFPSDVPAKDDTQQVKSPAGPIKESLIYRFSQQPTIPQEGGSLKIADSKTTFPASKTIAAAEVYLEPGALRTIHWHRNAEWLYFMGPGTARITIFAGSGNARTFDFGPGDTGYIEASTAHYVHAISDQPVKYLEIFKTDEYFDVSLSNWLALTPPKVVSDHLGFDATLLERFREKKYHIVKPTNLQ